MRIGTGRLLISSQSPPASARAGCVQLLYHTLWTGGTLNSQIVGSRADRRGIVLFTSTKGQRVTYGA